VLRVVEPVRSPSTGVLPARVRALVTSATSSAEDEHVAAARRQLDAARARLVQAGWRVKVETRMGRPLEELLAAARGADLLVIGARGVGAVERLFLGSVAEAAVTRAPVPVLVVR
jgi:nucleotide-binding universal stress UspA family protein